MTAEAHRRCRPSSSSWRPSRARRSPSASRPRASGAISRRTPSTTTPRTTRRTWRRRSCGSASSCSTRRCARSRRRPRSSASAAASRSRTPRRARRPTYTLVSAPEADPAEGKLSFDSPVGKALIGARVGDTVKLETPRGVRELKVLVYRRREAPQAVGEHVGRLQRREVPAVVRLLPALDVEHALRRRAAGRGRSPSGSRGRSAARATRPPAAATSSSTHSPCMRA